MKKYFASLSLNAKLALTAFVLGFVALFAGNPYHGSEATLNAKELALIVEKEVDHIGVESLADWIIQGKSDYRLIDLRSEKEYAEYHIPTAEQITLTGLESAPLLRSEKLVLYSEGGIHSAQAWMLLRAKGYKGVYMLRGGLEEWKDKILFPRIPENSTPELLVEFNKTREVSKYFGGTPQSGSAEGKNSPALSMPKLEMPSSGAAPALGGPKKKKKEGC
ncbi:MAG: rhodanese-like domain-containing protein [bacterium]